MYNLSSHGFQVSWVPGELDGMCCGKTLTFLQIDVSFLCVCPVIDHKFRHIIVKVAVDRRGDSRVDPHTTLTML